MRLLPPFRGLQLDSIVLLDSQEKVHAAKHEIEAITHVGFDTESKPVFQPNQPKTGPHLIQIATPSKAYLCPIDFEYGIEMLRGILASETIAKVGFGLRSDQGAIQRALGVKLKRGVELSTAVQRLGYQQKVGLQTAVAIVLGEYLQKSKKVTTSNWASRTLSEAQLLYAANDAYASLRVHLALDVHVAPKIT